MRVECQNSEPLPALPVAFHEALASAYCRRCSLAPQFTPHKYFAVPAPVIHILLRSILSNAEFARAAARPQRYYVRSDET